MRRFLIKIGLFGIMSLAFVIFVFYQADGSSDPYYYRFTTSRKKSLVLGTSRSAQGIVPSVLDNQMKGVNFFNFSFTLANSPFGPVYLKAIRNKLETSDEGMFVVSVTPWSMSSKKECNSISCMRENENFLNTLWCYNCNPNIQYLLQYYDGSYIDFLLPSNNPKMYLHKDGWLEVNVSMSQEKVKKRTQKKLKEYNEIADTYQPSSIRMEYLEKIIGELTDNGNVFLVRLPTSCSMVELEENYMPDFDTLMSTVSDKYGVPYFNFKSQCGQYEYTDGNHLYKKSSILFSDQLSQMMSYYLEKKDN